MRILLVDGQSEGASRTAAMLREQGHDVADFCAGTPQPDPMAAAKAIFGFDGTPSRLAAAIAEFRPDCVHVLNMHSTASPALGRTARRMGVRTLWSLHDYRPLCPAGECRTHDGEVCEECIHGSRRVMLKRCVDGRTFPSFMALLASLYWDRGRLEQCADVFLTHSAFMRSKLLEAGFPASRVEVLPAACPDYAGEVTDSREDFFCFAGDLTPESGIETLALAALETGVELAVCGDGPLMERLRQIAERGLRVSFYRAEEAPEVFARAKGAVVPSETYLCGADALALALCSGTPVVASAIGELTEAVNPLNGVCFNPGNREELEAILRDFDKRHAFKHLRIAEEARRIYSHTSFLRKLSDYYSDSENYL